MELDWSKIKTSVGFANDIPQQFTLLCSPISEDRKKAYWKIDNYAVLQSDLYEAAFYVINPLVNLLKKTKYKNEILNLLIEIADGYAPKSEQIIIDNKLEPLMQACQREIKKKYIFFRELLEETTEISEKKLLQELVNIMDEYEI